MSRSHTLRSTELQIIDWAAAVVLNCLHAVAEGVSTEAWVSLITLVQQGSFTFDKQY